MHEKKIDHSLTFVAQMIKCFSLLIIWLWIHFL
jgi:hypothetical protein